MPGTILVIGMNMEIMGSVNLDIAVAKHTTWYQELVSLKGKGK